MPLGLLYSLRSISGPTGMSYSLMLDSNPVMEYMHCPSASVTSSPNTGSPMPKPQKMLKLMLLQHAVWYHKARDWICQQDQSQVIYQCLLSHCRLLESRWKQYQKARERGWADLVSITTATASAFSIHADALTTQFHCNKCNYTLHPNKCPTLGQQCYTCGGSNHFTALCRQRNRRQRQPPNTPHKGNWNPQRCWSRCNGHHSSQYPGRQSCCHCSPSHSSFHIPSCSHPAVLVVLLPPLVSTIPIVGKPHTSTPRIVLTSYSLTVS